MKPFSSPDAFRSALEQRLKTSAHTQGRPVVRLRKIVSFDRFLARLLIVAPDRWLLKGGAALDFRLRDQARTTFDLDLAFLHGHEQVNADIIAALRTDVGDYFNFTGEQVPVPVGQGGTSAQFRIVASVGGRRFEQILVDIAWTDPYLGSEFLESEGLLRFAGIQPVRFPCIPVEQHTAEKVHAYTRTYVSGPSSRVKDLLDLALIAAHSRLEAARLRDAIDQTFAVRAAQSIPARLPEPPESWAGSYRRLAIETGSEPEVTLGHARSAALLDPVLRDPRVSGVWIPDEQRWSQDRSMEVAQ